MPQDTRTLPEPKVFISYAREDWDLVRAFVKALEAAGVEAVGDWLIPPTVPYGPELREYIQNASTFVFMISPDSVVSKACREEIDHAVALGKRFAPVVVRSIPDEAVHPALRSINYIFVLCPADIAEGVKRLREGIERDLDWERVHNRLLRRALDWEAGGRNRSLTLRDTDLNAAQVWLAQAGMDEGKKPRPTSIHSEYVLGSQREQRSRYRKTLAAFAAGLVVSLVFAAAAFYQYRVAQASAAEAQREQRIAEVSEIRAKGQEDIAILNELEARRQAGIAGEQAGIAGENERRATAERNRAEEQRITAEERLAENQQLLYAADINRVGEAYLANDIPLAVDLLKAHAPAAGQYPAQGFEWRYYWNLLHRDLHTFKGHEGIVKAVALSSDGTMLASASLDHTVKLWDMRSFREVTTLKENSAFDSVAFSPDGAILAAGCDDKTVKLWDTKSFQQTKILSGHNGVITSVAFSPDGKMLATASEDKTAKLWDMRSFQEITSLTGHESLVNSVAFSPDGSIVASASSDGTIRLWDTRSFHEIRKLGDSARPVTSVVFSSDGAFLAAGGRGVRFWDVRKAPGKAKTLSLDKEGVLVLSVAFSRDGNFLAAAGNDGLVTLWDTRTSQRVLALKGHQGMVKSVTFSPTENRLVSGSFDGTAKVWDIGHILEPTTLRAHDETVYTLAFSPDGRMLVTGSRDKTVKVWDTVSLRNVATLDRHQGFVEAAAFSPDGKVLATGSWDKTVRLWNVASFQEVATLPTKNHADCLAFSPDGKLLAAALYQENTIYIWDARSLHLRATLTGHKDVAYSVAFSRDGKVLATCSQDGSLRLWSTESFKEKAAINEPGESVQSLAFSPDGKSLATFGVFGTVRLLNSKSLRTLGTMNAIHHESKYFALNSFILFSKDGKTLVFPNRLGGIGLWSTTSFQQLAVLTSDVDKSSSPYAAAFSPDGRMLVASFFDGRLNMWRAN